MMYYEDEDSSLIEPHDENLRKIYHPLFEQYGIKLVLQAHTHVYERTYPLKANSENMDNPIVTNQDLNIYHNRDGHVIAIVGTGSAAPSGFSGDSEYTPVQYENLFGFLNVDVSSDGRKLVGTFYDNDGGEIKDQFTIQNDNNNEKY